MVREPDGRGGRLPWGRAARRRRRRRVGEQTTMEWKPNKSAGAKAGERGHVGVATERPGRAPRPRSAWSLARDVAGESNTHSEPNRTT